VATVQGPPRIAEAVRAILRGHGAATPAGACAGPGVRASLLAEPGAKSYLLHIEDPFGRQSDRHVKDAETAASLIETWAQPAVETLPALPLPPVAQRSSTAEGDVRSRAQLDAPRWRIVGALEVAGSTDSSLWYGGAVTGCGPVGPLCLGGRLRLAVDNNPVGSNHDVNRSATELLALAALPLPARGVTLTPAVGLGVGWTHSGSAESLADLDDSSGNDLGLRLEAAFSAAIPLGPHVALVGEVGASRGVSITSSTRADLAGTIAHVPSGYFRAAVACEYTP
jgi:hypothetical protein